MGVLGNGPTTHPSTRLIFVEPTLPVCTRRSRMSPTPPAIDTTNSMRASPRASSVKLLSSLQPYARFGVRLVLPLLFLSSLASALLPTPLSDTSNGGNNVNGSSRSYVVEAPVGSMWYAAARGIAGRGDGNGDASLRRKGGATAGDSEQKHSNISRPTSKSELKSLRPRLRICLVTLPLLGHAVPLVRLGEELIQRGHQVVLASHGTRKMIDLARSANIPFIAADHVLLAEAMIDEMLRRVTTVTTASSTRSTSRASTGGMGLRSILALFNEVYLPLSQPLYRGLIDRVQTFDPDIIVTDATALAGQDLAFAVGRSRKQQWRRRGRHQDEVDTEDDVQLEEEKEGRGEEVAEEEKEGTGGLRWPGIPCVVNSPSLLFHLDEWSAPTWLATPFPVWGSGLGQRELAVSLWERCANMLFPRLLSVALTPAFLHLNRARREDGLPLLRSQADVLGVGVGANRRSDLVLVNTAFGLEFPRPLSPTTMMVGPLMPSVDRAFLPMKKVSDTNGAATQKGSMKGIPKGIPPVLDVWLRGSDSFAGAHEDDGGDEEEEEEEEEEDLGVVVVALGHMPHMQPRHAAALAQALSSDFADDFEGCDGIEDQGEIELATADTLNATLYGKRRSVRVLWLVPAQQRGIVTMSRPGVVDSQGSTLSERSEYHTGASVTEDENKKSAQTRSDLPPPSSINLFAPFNAIATVYRSACTAIFDTIVGLVTKPVEYVSSMLLSCIGFDVSSASTPVRKTVGTFPSSPTPFSKGGSQTINSPPLESLPSNFRVKMLGMHLPHLELMAHPSVRAVVSHCGMAGAQEALFYAKPLVCVPFFGDQPDVAARVRDSGAGIVIDKNFLLPAQLSRDEHCISSEDERDDDDAPLEQNEPLPPEFMCASSAGHGLVGCRGAAESRPGRDSRLVGKSHQAENAAFFEREQSRRRGIMELRRRIFDEVLGPAPGSQGDATRRAAARMAMLLRGAGGTLAAADAIESTAILGTAHLRPFGDAYMPPHKKRNLDLLLLASATIAFLVVIIHMLRIAGCAVHAEIRQRSATISAVYGAGANQKQTAGRTSETSEETRNDTESLAHGMTEQSRE